LAKRRIQNLEASASTQRSEIKHRAEAYRQTVKAKFFTFTFNNAGRRVDFEL